MRSHICLMIGLMLLAMATGVYAQDFEGTFRSTSRIGDFSLVLEENSSGAYNGTLAGDGGLFSLEGVVENEILTGTAGDDLDALQFEVKKKGDKLLLTLSELDDDGRPVSETRETLVFDRMTPHSLNSESAHLIVNGTTLSDEQISQLEAAYGIRPLPGNYWYDALSGLYGAVGYPAYGFMLPDHQFGAMVRDASGGDTGVFVNGRELPLSEYTVWSYMVGSWIQPGSYWLDYQGNAGYEGNPVPVINLYVAAQQNSYSGQGGSGNNFWSTRFSAGNSNADNTQGYVSVPGYGPIGYGF